MIIFSLQYVLKFLQKLVIQRTGYRLSYSEVQITQADVCYVSDFYKVRDGLYKAAVTIKQKFVGMRDGKVIYEDITEKTINVYLQQEITSVGSQYVILLGDSEVLDTY